MKTLKWREFETRTRSERGETDSENWVVVWTGEMGENKTSLGKDFIKSWEDENPKNGWSNQERAWTSSYHGNQSVMAEQQYEMIQRSFN